MDHSKPASNQAHPDEVVIASPLGARRANTLRVRLIGLSVLAVCTAVLAVAVRTKPSPLGYGTHMQLGFPPCGSVLWTGYPCPTCGMTTAFAHAVRGNLIASFWAQPTGLVLALATMAAAVLGVYSTVTGRGVRFHGPPLSPIFTAWILLGLLFGGWGAKVLFGLIDGTLPARSFTIP